VLVLRPAVNKLLSTNLYWVWAGEEGAEEEAGGRRVRGTVLGEIEGWGQRTSGSARRPSLSQSTSVVPTSELERRGCEHVTRREDDLVELLRALIGFDTVTFAPGTPPREEEALQRFLGDRLAARDATVTVEEPDAALVAGHPAIPPGALRGRARPGGGSGRLHPGHRVGGAALLQSHVTPANPFMGHVLRVPRLSDADAVAVARQAFGVEGRAEEVGSHQDQK
jgi:hypothetical protein